MKRNLREKSLLLTAGGLILLVAGLVALPPVLSPHLLVAGLLCLSGMAILIALLSYAMGYQRGRRQIFSVTRADSFSSTSPDSDRS